MLQNLMQVREKSSPLGHQHVICPATWPLSGQYVTYYCTDKKPTQFTLPTVCTLFFALSGPTVSVSLTQGS